MLKKSGIFLAILACLMLAVGAATITAADKYPNGCADCHKKTTDKDLTYATIMKASYPKHPPVKATDDLNSCLKICHKSTGKNPLNKVMHDSHQKAKISCDACHIMKDGKVTAALKGVK